MVKVNSPATAMGRTVSDLMSDPSPVIERSAHLAAAAYLMRHAGMPELVVVDNQASRTPLAIITSFDIVRAVSHASDPSKATVAHWQSPKLTTVRPETTLVEALGLMLDGPQPHLPVIDADDKLVGAIDLIRLIRQVRPLLEDRGGF